MTFPSRETRFALLLIFTLCPFAAACGETAGQQNNQDVGLSGPCVEEFAEPVLIIESVTETNTEEAIEEVRISQIQWNGQSPPRHFRQEEFGISEDPDDEEVLLCTLPCGFGSNPGAWSFEINVQGYLPETLYVDAEYETFQGGCPALHDDGTRISVELEPTP